MDWTILVNARKILDNLWEKTDLRGRCWGIVKKEGNPFKGTNIVLAVGDELVLVSQDNDHLKIHEFVLVDNNSTSLGKQVHALIEEAMLPLKTQ